ncbi:ASCH domain-containing protein [Mollicutes bacterium LVI A0078]|nr:ASCH domain-containing protein [Mollicutes bacterium LVI A0075]WOO91867.1 ASCH domain-containing protein [Mollicutes bacterium LVI A0078]
MYGIIINKQICKMIYTKELTPEIAELEGEGTLEKWIEDHKLFFTNELKHKNMQFNDNHQVLTEVFEVVQIIK